MTTQCQCKDGFVSNVARDCFDIDECTLSTHSCSNSSTCINIEGAYKCFEPSTTPPSTTSETTSITTTRLTTTAIQTTLTTTTSTTTTSTTTTTLDKKTWILVLNKKLLVNVPMIIDGNGKSKEIRFSYNFLKGSEVFLKPCSIVWHGTMFVFGGVKKAGVTLTNSRVISKVEKCQLKKYGELKFDLVEGGCAQLNNEKVFLCFDQKSKKNCYESTGPLNSFTKLPTSTVGHASAQIAVSKGKTC